LVNFDAPYKDTDGTAQHTVNNIGLRVIDLALTPDSTRLVVLGPETIFLDPSSMDGIQSEEESSSPGDVPEVKAPSRTMMIVLDFETKAIKSYVCLSMLCSSHPCDGQDISFSRRPYKSAIIRRYATWAYQQITRCKIF
jgi:hypothetical protein